MTVTGQQILDNLALTAQYESDEQLAAVNRAISAAWPYIKLTKWDNSQVVASDTFVYTPTATDVNEKFGFANAYVESPGGQQILLRKVSQWRDDTDWIIVLDRETAQNYNGRALSLQYNAAVPQVATLDDAIDLPSGYLEAAISYYLTRTKLLKARQTDVENFKAIWREDKADLEKAQINYARGGLTYTIRVTHNVEIPAGTIDRYGAGILE